MEATAREAGIARFAAYIATLQPLMQLQHWEIEIAPEPPRNEDASASVHMHDGTWSAWVKLSDWFLEEADANRQRLHIVHELTHIYFRAMETAHVALITHFTMPQWSLIDGRFDVEKERAIDAIARVVAPHMPLPPDSA